MTTLLQQTPVWVWAVLALLIAYGASQLRERALSRPRVLIVPAVMTALSLSSVWQAFGASPSACLAWGLGALAGGLLNGLWLRQPQGLRVEQGLLRVPGSAVPLALMLLIFVTKYVVTASLATGWHSAAEAGFVLPASALLGALAGCFVSRALRMWRATRSP